MTAVGPFAGLAMNSLGFWVGALVVLVSAVAVLLMAVQRKNLYTTTYKGKKLPPLCDEPWSATANAFMTGQFYSLMYQRVKKMGPVFRFRQARPQGLLLASQAYVVADYTHFRRILIQAPGTLLKHPTAYTIINEAVGLGKQTVVARQTFGEHWAPIRKGVAPAFSMTNLSKRHHMIHKCLDALHGKFEACAASGTPLDLSEWFIRLTIDVIGLTAFDFEINALQGSADGQLILAGIPKLFIEFGSKRMYAPWRKYVPFLFKEATEAESIKAQCHDLCTRMIKQYRERHCGPDGVPRKDDTNILAQILRVPTTPEGKLSYPHGDESLIADVMGFLFAGHDTTGFTMAWCAYELCQEANRGVLEKVQREAAAVLAGKRHPDYADIGRLTYLHAVFKETARKWPVGTNSMRIAAEDIHIGEYIIPKGAPVMLPIFSVHRSDLWEEPHGFLPDRWLQDAADSVDTDSANIGKEAATDNGCGAANDKNQPALVPGADKAALQAELRREAYMPFNLGPRNCVGMNLALLEARTALCSLFNRFEFIPHKLPNPAVPGEAFALLKPNGGIWVVPKLRQ